MIPTILGNIVISWMIIIFSLLCLNDSDSIIIFIVILNIIYSFKNIKNTLKNIR